MSVGRNTASGHLRAASRIGIPECTPNSLASREGVATTARAWVGSPEPPTITGLPRNSGRRSISTEAKNWSRSTCNSQTPVIGPVSAQHHAQRRTVQRFHRLADGAEFLTTFTVTFPADTPEETVVASTAGEA